MMKGRAGDEQGSDVPRKKKEHHREAATAAPAMASWRATLEARGHLVADAGCRVLQRAGAAVTVAVEPDATLRPEYRGCYFLSVSEPASVLRAAGCPKPLADSWCQLVSRQPAADWRDFLAGPGSWLLSRLARLGRVVAWAEGGLAWGDLDCPTHRGWGVEVPAGAAPLFADGPDLLLVEVDDCRFAETVAACLLFASVGMRDCHLAGLDGAEVYLAHHHDKVVASVPDADTRGVMVRQLTHAGAFEDVSGYGG
jgi:hypothetical protein